MEHLQGNTYYYGSVVSQGGYSINNEWLLIDTGSDASSARKSIRNLDSPKIKYVFNTHSHADHCGGNHYFHKKYNPDIIAPVLEASFIEHPILEPSYLYGAMPPAEMENKFLKADSSKVSVEIDQETSIDLTFDNHMTTFKIIPLPGHSPNMAGIITPDGIAFIGDALLGEIFLSKHPLLFTFDLEKHLESINRLLTLKVEAFVLSHGGYMEDITRLAEKNIESLLSANQLILDSCTEDNLTFDRLHHLVFNKLNLKENLSTNMLNRSIIKAHVQYLVKHGKLSLVTEKGQVFIQK